MRKFTTLIFLLALVLPARLLAAQQEAITRPAGLDLWEKAKDLEGKGSYLEAREIYESLLKQEDLGGRQKRRIRRDYEDLEMKILFSRIETPDSLFHAVVAGDTLSEIAKKYGTTIELIQKSNGLSGDKIYIGTKLKVTRTQFSILVEKRPNRLTLLGDNKPLKRYKVATGMDGSTPAGIFKVVNKLKDPTWFRAGAVVPPDSPENILGSRWLGFDLAGYGIHGTTLPQTIGTQSSKGCIRMLNNDVEEIYAIVPAGTSVVVKE